MDFSKVITLAWRSVNLGAGGKVLEPTENIAISCLAELGAWGEIGIAKQTKNLQNKNSKTNLKIPNPTTTFTFTKWALEKASDKPIQQSF